MKELELLFEGTGEVKNVTFKQLDKSDKGYFYELTDKEDNSKRWEVFHHREQKEADVVFDGVSSHYEAKVRYPKSTNFGDWAWCFTNYDLALTKFCSL
jgi:hypothetical protein